MSCRNGRHSYGCNHFGSPCTTEWQKCGLTHAHIVLIMDKNDKPHTPQMVDKLVNAEIPDPVANPRLDKIVTNHMIHGPCGQFN